MKKQTKPAAHSGLKDFLYNTNDVLVTAVILIAALIIIGWRVNVIMAYPKHLTSGNVKTATEVKKDAQKSSASAESSAEKESAAKAENKDKDEDNNVVKAEYKDGRLTKTITIHIMSGSLNSAMSQLKAFGVYETHHEFKVYCHQAGRKASSLKAGPHTLKKGWTKEKIAKALTN